MPIQIQTSFPVYWICPITRILVNAGEMNISKERFKCQVNGKDLEHQSSWCTHHKCQVINKRWKEDNSPAKSCFLILLADYKLFITGKFLKNRVKHLHDLSTSSQHLTGCSGYKHWETQHAIRPTHSLPMLRRWMDRAIVGTPKILSGLTLKMIKGTKVSPKLSSQDWRSFS